MNSSEKNIEANNEQDALNNFKYQTVSSEGNALQVITTSARRALQNLFIISFAYFLFFSGFWSLSNLQSTMNAQGGLGPDSQAVIYLFSMVSCLFPQTMIEKFGSKYTFVAALLVSCPYIAANFCIRWDVMMTTSVLYGLASGPLNAALMFYLDEMATRYKASVDDSIENVKAFFFGFNIFFGEITQILGNGISYFVLEKGKHIDFSNSSVHNDCGVNFYPGARDHNNTNLTPPSENERLMLIGVYFILCLLSVFVALFLDPLRNDVRDVRGCQAVSKTLCGSLDLMRRPDHLLLIPISIFCGIESAFYANEFTEVSRNNMIQPCSIILF